MGEVIVQSLESHKNTPDSKPYVRCTSLLHFCMCVFGLGWPRVCVGVCVTLAWPGGKVWRQESQCVSSQAFPLRLAGFITATNHWSDKSSYFIYLLLPLPCSFFFLYFPKISLPFYSRSSPAALHTSFCIYSVTAPVSICLHFSRLLIVFFICTALLLPTQFFFQCFSTQPIAPLRPRSLLPLYGVMNL